MMINLSTVTMEDLAVMGADGLTEALQAIGGRLLELAVEVQDVEPKYRTLKAEAAYLAEAKGAIQSALRMHRLALGG